MDVTQTVFTYVKKCAYEKYLIGNSVLGLPIYAFTVEKTPRPCVIVTAAIHAREYITAYLSLYLAEDFLRRGRRGRIFFIPLVNPDGVKIAQTQTMFKANANGVDLNVNFDAGWGTGKLNVKTRGAENYIGEKPFSEPETQALRDFTLKASPDATLSFHSKGREIYYGFNGRREYDRILAQKIADFNGYKVKPTPGSAGGYKDWCVDKLSIPSFTVEVGDDSLTHPIRKNSLKAIIKENADDLIILTENL